MRARKIRGEALTTRILSTRQGLVEILQRLLGGRNAALRQDVEELGPAHSRKLRGAALGDPTLRIPDDRGRQAHLSCNLFRRSPQGRKDVGVEFHLYPRHLEPPVSAL